MSTSLLLNKLAVVVLAAGRVSGFAVPGISGDLAVSRAFRTSISCGKVAPRLYCTTPHCNLRAPPVPAQHRFPIGSRVQQSQETPPPLPQPTMSAQPAAKRDLVLDAFAMRQFTDPEYTGTKVDYDPEEFEAKINELYEASGRVLADGYAPFCKHIFVPNFAGVQTSMVRITPENEGLLRSGYEARVPQELPVLVRWFPKGSVETPVAKYLDIILYSREQIRKENAEMGKETSPSDAPWGIISVKAQDTDGEIPMQPITMMRNALGKDQGGSGVGLERSKYEESVDFWKDHAPMK